MFEEQFGFENKQSFTRSKSDRFAANAAQHIFKDDGVKLGESKARDIAQKVYQALNHRLIIDKQLLVDTLAPLDWAAMGAVAREFEILHPKKASLREAIATKVHWKLRTILLAIVTPPDVLRAEIISNAIQRSFPDVGAILDALVGLDGAGINAVLAAYKELESGVTLQQHIQEHFQDLMKDAFELLINIPATGSLGSDSASTAAEKLYAAGEKKLLGTDKNVFVNIILGASASHLAEIKSAYPLASKKKATSLEDCIKNEFGLPHERNLKRILLSRVRTHDDYWAAEAEKALRGAGTDTEVLGRLVSLNSPGQLQQIAARYSQIHDGRVMHSDIGDDVSGWWGKFIQKRLESKARGK